MGFLKTNVRPSTMSVNMMYDCACEIFYPKEMYCSWYYKLSSTTLSVGLFFFKEKTLNGFL